MFVEEIVAISERLDTLKEIHDDIKEMTPLQFTDSADSWINCKYELPQHLKNVLVCTKNGVIIEAYYDEDRKEWTITNSDSRIANITHWQPLPEPPKGE